MKVCSHPPGKPDGVIESLDSKAISDRFGFDYIEELEIAESVKKELNFADSSSAEFTPVYDRLKDPLTDSLIVCKIDDSVGCGVFTTEPIAPNTVICIYAGTVEPIVDGMIDDYGLGIGADGYRVSAAKKGGVGRFIQHLPENIAALHSAIDDADGKTFLAICSANRIWFQEMPNFNDLGLLSAYKNKVKEVLAETFFKQELDLSDELGTKSFFHTHEHITTIASANAKVECVVYKGVPYPYIKSTRPIAPGEQIGFSYGINYWIARQKVPRYFDHSGALIPISNYLEDLAIIRERNGNRSASACLRKTTAEGNQLDIAMLLEYGVDINAQDPVTGRTALHWAGIKGNVPLFNMLTARGGSHRIKDRDGVVPKSYLTYTVDRSQLFAEPQGQALDLTAWAFLGGTLAEKTENNITLC